MIKLKDTEVGDLLRYPSVSNSPKEIGIVISKQKRYIKVYWINENCSYSFGSFSINFWNNIEKLNVPLGLLY